MLEDGSERIRRAITKLWSAGRTERGDAVEEILGIGSEAIDLLVSLLTDLVRDQGPRFPAGEEERGARLLQESHDAKRRYCEGFSISHDESWALTRQIGALSINSELMFASVYLLGELKAEAAVPILMEITHKEYEPHGRCTPIEMFGGCRSTETDALCRIGHAAVPQLIENLSESKIRAYGFGTIFYGWHLEEHSEGSACDTEAALEGVEDEDLDDYDDDDDDDFDEEAYEKRRVNKSRQRVVWTLGEIGDPRALPALEALSTTIENDVLTSRINEAANRIRGENSLAASDEPRLEQVFVPWTYR